MAEIEELKKHIITYSGPKDIYAAYRKSGYSDDYFEKYSEAILIHKAAKNRFGQFVNSKITSIKYLKRNAKINNRSKRHSKKSIHGKNPNTENYSMQ